MLLIGKLRKLTISKAMFNSYFDITRGYVGLKCCWKNPRLRRPLLSPAWETSPCSAPNRACPFGSSAKVQRCPAPKIDSQRYLGMILVGYSWILTTFVYLFAAGHTDIHCTAGNMVFNWLLFVCLVACVSCHPGSWWIEKYVHKQLNEYGSLCFQHSWPCTYKTTINR